MFGTPLAVVGGREEARESEPAPARAQLRAVLDRLQIEPAIVRALAARGLDPRAAPDRPPDAAPDRLPDEPS
jgi:hypothetical protein